MKENTIGTDTASAVPSSQPSAESPFLDAGAGFPTPAVSTSTRVSVSVPVKEDGTPDWSKASEKIRKRFAALFNDPATQAEFAQASDGGMDPMQARMLGMMLLSTINQVQSLAAVLKYKLTKEEIQECFTSDYKPYPNFEEALARVMAKRGPAWLAAWADELYVGQVVLLSSFAAWSKASAIAAEKKRKASEQVKEVSPLTGVPVYDGMPSGVPFIAEAN